MASLGRLSTNHRFESFKTQFLVNQNNYFRTVQELNTGKKLLKAEDDPRGVTSALETRAAIGKTEQRERNFNFALAELDLAELSLSSIKDALDRVKEISLNGASDTMGPDERISLGREIRQLGETIVQLSNTKSGSKYIFSGKQTNLQTVSLEEGAAFSTFAYKDGAQELGQRNIEGVQTSIDLKEALTGAAQSAKVNGGTASPTITGSLKLVVNDGNGNNLDIPEITFAADTLANVITTINTQFNAAGGVGTIASQNPAGSLELNTANITGNIANDSANITIAKGNGITSAVADLQLNPGSTSGKSQGILNTLASLEIAYNSNDSEAIRDLLVDIDSNTQSMINIRSKQGATVSRIDDIVARVNASEIDLIEKIKSIEEISYSQKISELNVAQSALEASLQASATIFGQNVFNFLNF